MIDGMGKSIHLHKLRVAQEGRSMLELIAVLFVMGLLTLGAIAIYDNTITKHKADSLYNDVMVRFLLNNERKGQIFSTDMSNTTAFGLPIVIRRDKPVPGYNKVTILNVENEICNQLINKSWPKESRIYLNEEVYPTYTDACPTQETAFSIVAKSSRRKQNVELPKICNTLKPCNACQNCVKGECLNACASDEVCSGTGNDVACAPMTCDNGLCCPPVPDDCEDGAPTAGDATHCACNCTGYVIDGSCYACPQHATCNGETVTTCETDYYLEDQTCHSCPAHATCDGEKIVTCETDYYLHENVCHDCPSQAVCNGIKVVSCVEGFHVVGNGCYAYCTEAKPWMQVEFNQDELPRFITRGVCHECTYASAHTTINEESCNNCIGYRFLSKDLMGDPKCYYCGDRTYKMTTNKIADINADSCNACINRHYEAGKGCVCNDNMKYTQNGTDYCCPPGKHPEGSSCQNGDPVVCDGYTVDGVCHDCPQNAVCDGYNVVSCNGNYILDGNTCTACPDHSVCNGTNVTGCENGYYLSGTVCNACPDHATCANNVITCNSGYILENDTCVSNMICNGVGWLPKGGSCQECLKGSASSVDTEAGCTANCLGYRILGRNNADTEPKCWNCGEESIVDLSVKKMNIDTCNACLNRYYDSSKPNYCRCKSTHIYNTSKCCKPGTHANSAHTGCVSDNCSGHGTYANGVCNCTDNYYGDECETAPLTCQHGGQWDATNHVCDCTGTGYEGTTCETPSCSGWLDNNGNCCTDRSTQACCEATNNPSIMSNFWSCGECTESGGPTSCGLCSSSNLNATVCQDGIRYQCSAGARWVALGACGSTSACPSGSYTRSGYTCTLPSGNAGDTAGCADGCDVEWTCGQTSSGYSWTVSGPCELEEEEDDDLTCPDGTTICSADEVCCPTISSATVTGYTCTSESSCSTHSESACQASCTKNCFETCSGGGWYCNRVERPCSDTKPTLGPTDPATNAR